MKHKTGTPELMKQINLSLLYEALIELGSATRAELAEKTQVSATTVRALLEPLVEGGEIIELALDESSGGRRAQRYALNSERNLILSMYLEKGKIFYQISDLLETVHEMGETTAQGIEDVRQFVTYYCGRREIVAIGLGVPGVVEKRGYYTLDKDNRRILNTLGEEISAVFPGVVVLENDLNATALGFALRYGQQQGKCYMEDSNIVYLYFQKGCTGAGIIADGKIIRGARKFAGELGFLPLYDGKTLDELSRHAADDEEAARLIGRTISILSCVTNPSHVVIGGDIFKSDERGLELVREQLEHFSIEKNCAEMVTHEVEICREYRSDYLSGLAFLTRQAVVETPR